MTSTTISKPQRGEIWKVDFRPPKGAEIDKVRPALVISSDAVGKLPLKVVVPITEWDNRFATNLWHIRIDPNATNGLSKASAIDAFQVRSVSLNRFQEKLGVASADIVEEVTSAIAAVIEHQ